MLEKSFNQQNISQIGKKPQKNIKFGRNCSILGTTKAIVDTRGAFLGTGFPAKRHSRNLNNLFTVTNQAEKFDASRFNTQYQKFDISKSDLRHNQEAWRVTQKHFGGPMSTGFNVTATSRRAASQCEMEQKDIGYQTFLDSLLPKTQVNFGNQVEKVSFHDG